jgi:hypothetical protein
MILHWLYSYGIFHIKARLASLELQLDKFIDVWNKI